MVTLFFDEMTYLSFLDSKSRWPPNIIHLWTCRIPCRSLIHFLKCSHMIDFALNNIVYNEMITTFLDSTKCNI